MTPGLLLPIALAAFAAVLAPLVIHIARRSEERPTVFAALRWLRQKPRPRSRLRFDEPLLLASRILLLALLALWLAHPVLFGAAGKTPYVAVVPGADVAQGGSVAGQPVADHRRAHWLAPGFPALTETRPTAPIPTASLLRQLDADLPAGTPLIVVTPQVIDGADAERPRLSRSVDWRVVPGAAPAVPVPTPEAPPLSIRHGDGRAGQVRYLRAAALAWQPAGRSPDLEISDTAAALPRLTRRLVWLDAGSLPPALLAWVEAGGTALVSSDALPPANADRAVLWRDDLGRPLVEATPLGRGRLLRFTRPLTPAETPQLLEADFPTRLRAVLEPPARPPARASAADYAPVLGARHVEPAPRDLRPWLAVLIGLVLLVERWLATRRRRGVSP